MKLYATTTSERASKGQGGNEYLDIVINIIDKKNPSYRLLIQNDSKKGQVDITLQSKFFGTWRNLHITRQFYNVPKGEKQKGEMDKSDCSYKHKSIKEICECKDCKQYLL